MRKFIAAADAINRRVGRAAAWLALAMTAVVFAMIVLSTFFRLGWVWMRETVTYMHGALFMAAAGYTLLRDEHVRIDVFYAKLSPRGKAWVNILGFTLLLTPVCVLILWTSFPYVYESWRVLESSDEASGIPALFLLKTFLLVFPLLMILQGLALAMRGVLILQGEVYESESESKSETNADANSNSESDSTLESESKSETESESKSERKN